MNLYKLKKNEVITIAGSNIAKEIIEEYKKKKAYKKLKKKRKGKEKWQRKK